MASVIGAMRGGFFPESWDIPLALGLGVVVTGFLGDTVAGFISQWIPADWLNPTAELIVGVLLWLAGGWMTGDMSKWLRLFSLGAFAVGIADAVTVVLGLVSPPAAAAGVRVYSAGTRVATPIRTGQGTYRA